MPDTVAIECFFDCSSPWTWLSFRNIQPMAAELKVPIIWKPVLVGGIFNAVNPSVYESRERPVPAKAAYMKKDLQDWAQQAGVTILFPPTVFPVNSVKAMRACIALAPQGKLVPFAEAVFKAYWSDDRDISQEDVLRDIARALNLDDDALMKEIATPAIKDQLKANTDEVIRRGGFGSPTFFVGDDDMYFGNDRLSLIREAILRKRA